MENSIPEIPNDLPAARKRYKELLEYERKLDKLFRMLDRFLKEGKRGDMTDEYFAEQMKRADKTRRNMSAEKNALEEKINELQQETELTGEQNVIFKKNPLKLILKKSPAQKIPTKTTSFPEISLKKVKLVHISPMVLPEVLRPKNVSLTQELQPFKSTEKRVLSCGIPKCIQIMSRGHEKKHSLHVSSKTGLSHLSLDLSFPTASGLDLSFPTASGLDLSRAFTITRQRMMPTLTASTMHQLHALEKLMPLKHGHGNFLEVKQSSAIRWTVPQLSCPAVLPKNDLKCLINMPQRPSLLSAFLLLQQLIRRVGLPRAFSIPRQPMMWPSTASKMQHLHAPGKLMPLDQGTGTLLVVLQPTAVRSLSISVLTMPPSSKPPQFSAFLPEDGSNCSIISMPLNSHLMSALLSLPQLMCRELRPIMDSSQLPLVSAPPQSARLSLSTLLPDNASIRLLVTALRQSSYPTCTPSSRMLLPAMESSQIMHCSLHKTPSAPPELSPPAAMLKPLLVAETLPPANQSSCGKSNLANYSEEIPPCSSQQIQIITETPDVVLESSLPVAKILPPADQSLCHDNVLANHSKVEIPTFNVVVEPLPLFEILPPADQSLCHDNSSLANHSEVQITPSTASKMQQLRAPGKLMHLKQGPETFLVVVQPSASRSLSISVLTLPPSSKPLQFPAFLPEDGSNCSIISMPLNLHLMSAYLSLPQLMRRELRPIIDSSQLPLVNAEPQSARLSVSTLLPDNASIRLLITALLQRSNPICTPSPRMLAVMLEPLLVAETLPPANQSSCGKSNLANYSEEIPTCSSQQIQITTETPDVVLEPSLPVAKILPPADQSFEYEDSLTNHSKVEIPTPHVVLQPLPLFEILPPTDQSLCDKDTLGNHFVVEIPTCSQKIQIIKETPKVVLESLSQIEKVLPADQSLCDDNNLANHSEDETPPCSSQQVQITTDTPAVVLESLPVTEILPPADQSLRGEDSLANDSEVEIPPYSSQQIQIITDKPAAVLESLPMTVILPPADQSLRGEDSLVNHSEVEITSCSNQQIQITSNTPEVVPESLPVAEILPPADQSLCDDNSLTNHSEVEIKPYSSDQIITDTPAVVPESLPVTDILPPADQSLCDDNSLTNHSEVEITSYSSQQIQIITDKPAVVLESLPATKIFPPADQSLCGKDTLANHSEVEIPPCSNQQIQITTDTPEVVLESLPVNRISPPADQSLCDDNSLANHSEVKIPPCSSQQMQITIETSHHEEVEIADVDESLKTFDTQDTLSTVSGCSETESMLGSKKKRPIGRRILALFTCCCFCKQRQ